MDPERRRNVRVAVICAAFFFGMIGAAFASVPLYRAFCQITGFDGATRRATAASDTVLAKTLTVRFDANVREAPLVFTAEQRAQEVKIGETKLAFFKVTNTSDKAVTARAIYLGISGLGGLVFLLLAFRLFRSKAGEAADPRNDDGLYDVRAGARDARNLFAFSILYLALLFATLLGEHLAGAAPLELL